MIHTFVEWRRRAIIDRLFNSGWPIISARITGGGDTPPPTTNRRPWQAGTITAIRVVSPLPP